jgi:hypothetical protein
MSAQYPQNDVTNSVDLCDAQAVADAVCVIAGRRYSGFDPNPLRQGFTDMAQACAGRYPGLLMCDTPYHDLRHFLDVALLMARLVDGYEMREDANDPLSAEQFSVAVLLALFHDVGLLRRANEAHLQGAALTGNHERRGVDFMWDYLARGQLAPFADQAALILVTDMTCPVAESLRGLPVKQLCIGQMLGTADLLSQLSGRYYLENCRDALYSEFVISGANRTVLANGETQVLYESPQDLLRKTPAFFENIAKSRLEQDFAQVYRHLVSHFGGDDPYARGMYRNLAYIEQLAARNDFSGLRRIFRARL